MREVLNAIRYMTRWTPDDVAAFVSFLAGPDSDFMMSQAPLIDGGIVYR
jgi:meso-butanediol dehydrogenase / (S,S)-butanediol dehydrogenase / diacetyl reductase